MKSSTDAHWNARATSVADDVEVNIMDIFQRNLEYDYVEQYLAADMAVLEVGCGNGFSTTRFRKLARHVDSFDYAPAMIARAKERYGELNNRFYVDNILAPSQTAGPYDTVVCVRVLINLRDLDEQHVAIRNMAAFLKPGGRLILVEGYKDGFGGLNQLRESTGLPPLQPAAINFYSSLADVTPLLNELFSTDAEFHLGAYDYLTRLVYPSVAGAENVRHNSVFAERAEGLARVFNQDCFKALSRVRGLVLRLRPRDHAPA